jgi:hypothetical protein
MAGGKMNIVGTSGLHNSVCFEVGGKGVSTGIKGQVRAVELWILQVSECHFATAGNLISFK